VALRSPTQTHSYWGPYASGSLPTSSNVQVGDTAYDTSLGSLVVCTALAPSVAWTAVGSTPPASPKMAIQFNNVGAFGGSADLTYDATTQTVLLEDTGSAPRQFVELATGSTSLGVGPSLSIGEDNAGSIASVTLSADNMTAGGPAILRAENPFSFPSPIDLQILDLQINGDSGVSGYVLQSRGPAAAPLWIGPESLALPIILSLDGTSASTVATNVGGVYIPNAITLGVNSQARLGTSGTAQTVTLQLLDATTSVVVATFSASITGFASVAVTGTPTLSAGWYAIVLTADAKAQAFARGLYLTV